MVAQTNEEQQLLKYHWFNVKMTCSGCSGAITRVLDKMVNEEKVTEFKVDLEKQEVNVTGPVEYDELLERIKKTGKQVIEGKTLESPGAPQDEPEKKENAEEVRHAEN